MTAHAQRRVETRYERVGACIETLIPALGLTDAGPLVMGSYELLCRDSVGATRGQRRPRASRLNADGTPFQVSLTLGAGGPRLGFLADAGIADRSASERLADDRERIRKLAEALGAERALAALEPLIGQMAPSGDRALLADHASAFWIGSAFAPATLKVYVNAKWGEMERRWARLDAFADYFAVRLAWRQVRGVVDGELEPLGVGLAAGPDAEIRGRVYLWGLGKPFAFLERVAGACDSSSFEVHVRRFCRTLLEEEYNHPARSVVCSFGVVSGRLADVKVELCAHCAFDGDVQASERCRAWLRADVASTTVYERVLAVLSGGALSETGAMLHAYVGIGSGNGEPKSTFYFNPLASDG
jgi:hypothetical protein